MFKKYRKILIIGISLILISILAYISNMYSSEQIVEYISKAGIYAPLIYILIQTLGQIFAPLSTSVFFVAGFILFGRAAILYMIVVWSITSVTNFLIARRYGKDVLRFFVGVKGLNTVQDILRGLGNKQYLVLRFLTFYINDFASYAFGLTDIHILRYVWVTILSMIPWTVIMTLVMQESSSILVTTVKVFAVMIPFSLVGYIFFKKISLRRLIREVKFRVANRRT